MARATLFLALLTSALVWPDSVAGQAHPVDTLQTRAERTDYRETTRYAEVVTFVEAIAKASPQAHLTTMGYTSEGRAIPLLVLGNVPDASPESVLGSGKLRVYLQGNIHAGEVPGKEAMLMLARSVARGDGAPWMDDLVLLVAPIYNADGNERVSLTNRPRQNGPVAGMGQRPNAQGLDLNRDHMKLDSPEARSLAGMLTAYDPHITVDLHTTNGTRHAYHLTYSPPLHPGTPASIDALLREDAFPTITDRILEKHGWHMYYYGNTYRRGGNPGWYTFDHRPRFGSNYAGIRNRIGILSEAYAYATFEDRVLATLRFVTEILDWSVERQGRIREVVRMADASPVGERLPVRADVTGTEEVEILMGAVEEQAHPYTGAVVLNRLDEVRPTTMREYGTFSGTHFEVVPARYLIPPEVDVALDRLAAHGVQMEVLASATTQSVEAFRVDSTRVAQRVFQGHRERELFGEWTTEEREFPAGTRVVQVNQPLGRLAFYLLEPRSDDGLTNWALLDEYLGEAPEVYPIFRVRE